MEEVDEPENDLNSSQIFTCCSPIDESLDSILENPTRNQPNSFDNYDQELNVVYPGVIETQQPESSRNGKKVDVSILGANLGRISEATKRGKGEVERHVFKVKSDKDVLEDGFKWRKYGKKLIKNSPYPRNYYKCADNRCDAKKRVEKDPQDPSIVVTTYEGRHNHETPAMVVYVEKPYTFQ